MKTGLFRGEDMLLDLGDHLHSCCEDCYNHYNPMVKKHKKRFAIKLDSYRYATKSKPTAAEEIKMFAAYVAEANAYAPKQLDAEAVTSVGAFALITSDGRFTVTEASNSFLKSDVDFHDQIKTVTKALKAEPNWFTKDDITMIEYASNGMGVVADSNHQVYSYTIRLNDEKTLTYRPCITRSSVLGKGTVFNSRDDAEKNLLAELILFKTLIGSDLPITRGTKR